jgi:hypothetical protein
VVAEADIAVEVTNCVLCRGVRRDEEKAAHGIEVVIHERDARHQWTRRMGVKFVEGRLRAVVETLGGGRGDVVGLVRPSGRRELTSIHL